MEVQRNGRFVDPITLKIGAVVMLHFAASPTLAPSSSQLSSLPLLLVVSLVLVLVVFLYMLYVFFVMFLPMLFELMLYDLLLLQFKCHLIVMPIDSC